MKRPRQHGKRGSYVSGCHCVLCRKANAAYWRQYIARVPPAPIAPLRVVESTPVVRAKRICHDAITGETREFEVITDLVLGDRHLATVIR